MGMGSIGMEFDRTDETVAGKGCLFRGVMVQVGDVC
jgi:hypothetical protein